MTDGIIQNVFRKYYRQLEFHKRLSLDTKDFKTIEQELIEEIKKITYHEQDIINCTCEHCLTVATISEILIGDNQE